MAPEPVLLESIKTLTFYKDEMTAARRTSAIPQLTCIGKACALYQPEVVQCANTGGNGVDINWKCEADLPAALRFGRVSVGCEGWSRSGDPYVLKGSCGLEYRLIQIPNQYSTNNGSSYPSSARSWSIADYIYYTFFIGILIWMLWSIVKSCIPSLSSSRPTNSRPGGGSRPNAYPSAGGRYVSGRYNPLAPPPPYSEQPPPKPSSSASSDSNGTNWQPGFWSGVGLGAAGTYLATNAARNRDNRQYDWERSQFASAPEPSARQAGYSPPESSYRAMGQGEGSSSGGGSLGPSRRATGYGGTNVR